MKRTVYIKILVVFITSLLLIPEKAAGQRVFRFKNRLEHDHRPYHFGFSLGLNTMNLALRPVEELQQEYDFEYVLPEPDYGFHIGIVSNLKLHRYLDLRFIPTISFGDRYLEYYLPDYNPDNPNTFSDWERRDPEEKQDYEVTMLEFPLHLKYKSARMTNTRVYVLGGFKYTHDLASIELGVGDDILARVARNDLHYELGAGIDHYFYYFKFSAEIKASFGMLDLVSEGELGPEFYNSIDRLNSRSIMLSLTFE